MEKKKYIILIGILILFFLVMFLLFGRDSLRKERQKLTIIVGDNTVWSYHNKKWSNVSSYDELNWNKYIVYYNNEKKGNYYLWHDDKWYVFDNNKSALSFNGELLAYQSNEDLSITAFSVEDVLDDTSIFQVLEEKDISSNNQFTSKYQVSFDIDGDGINEIFYVVSNAFAHSFNPDTIFSIVYMVKDNLIYPIYENISSNQGLNGCKPYFQSFLDVDQDNKYEFILSCGYYSNSRRSDMLYRLTDEGFKIIVSNQ